MNIFIVDLYDPNDNSSIVVHVASTIEKAVIWISRNRLEYPGVLSVCKEVVDSYEVIIPDTLVLKIFQDGRVILGEAYKEELSELTATYETIRNSISESSGS